MYLQPASTEASVETPGSARVVLWVTAAITVAVGVVPWPLLDWVGDAIPF